MGWRGRFEKVLVLAALIAGRDCSHISSNFSGLLSVVQQWVVFHARKKPACGIRVDGVYGFWCDDVSSDLALQKRRL